MGVPVVTCMGPTFAGRHSTSYLSTASLSEFIANDLNGYVETAVAWANRLDELAVLRATLRERFAQSPVCDAQGFANDFLDVLTRAFESRGTRHSSR
jgi:protein O-GlcNAc transferase